ncbi:MAG TPA: methyltransferase domain-containing protein [Mycobacterium sp.]|uniref:methyltransferase domain-containing protein n=1 Tax=Mycolicibacterium sp. TaxID=2320850 RepID=UPI0025CE22ED|nr:methyltransferase domain-containing protein [Mycolicibacterium sp.]HPX35179.1 methyltransferase domain-containing protein [Mycobacterium sp.]HQC75593.1 methyltransferase domain-containing protein [Mycobacterium sp.]
MSAHLTDAADPGLPLTGERTVPGLAEENYWFRRHEVAYRHCAPLCAGQEVLEAGCGEGYGADLLAGSATRVVAVDYDAATVAHVRTRYPSIEVIAANLAALPLADASVDVVVNFQVIEHLWDQPQFITECLRVLRPGGLLLISTPNRITFTPGSDVPVNPFHTRELNAAELTELLVAGGFGVDGVYGVFHGPRLIAMDARHGGSIIDAQIDRALADAPWPHALLADVAAVQCADFEIVDSGDRDIDASLDLLAIAVRP